MIYARLGGPLGYVKAFRSALCLFPMRRRPPKMVRGSGFHGSWYSAMKKTVSHCSCHRRIQSWWGGPFFAKMGGLNDQFLAPPSQPESSIRASLLLPADPVKAIGFEFPASAFWRNVGNGIMSNVCPSASLVNLTV